METLQQIREALGIGVQAPATSGAGMEALSTTATQDGMSSASEILAWLTSSVEGALPALTMFAFAVVGAVALARLANAFVDAYAELDTMVPYGAIVKVAWGAIGSMLAIGLLAATAIPFFNSMHSAGLTIGGVADTAIPAGELARYADTVTNSIDLSVQAIRQQGIWDRIGAIPEVVTMKLIGILIWFFFIGMALISFWLTSQSLFGLIMGFVTVGLIAWQKSQPIGMKTFAFVAHSGLPLFAMGFLMAIVMKFVEGAVMADGTPASMDILWHILTVLVVSIMFLFAIPAAARGLLMTMAGTGGAPDIGSAARTAGGAGGAISRTMSAIKSISAGGGGGKALPPSSGGGGSRSGFSPRSSSSAPSIMPRITSK